MTGAVSDGLAGLRRRWQAMSSRERLLLAVLGGLVVLAVLIYGVVKPLQGARAEALADIRSHETLNARIRAVGSLVPAGARAPAAGPIDQRLNAAAARAGIRATVAADGGVYRVSLTDARYDAMVAWLADARTATGAAIVRAEVLPGGAAGQVNATFEFQP